MSVSISIQNRCSYLTRRCYTGLVVNKQETKRTNIPEIVALNEWPELLEKRLGLTRRGGVCFVREIRNIVDEHVTPLGLDLTDRPRILQLLEKWVVTQTAT